MPEELFLCFPIRLSFSPVPVVVVAPSAWSAVVAALIIVAATVMPVTVIVLTAVLHRSITVITGLLWARSVIVLTVFVVLLLALTLVETADVRIREQVYRLLFRLRLTVLRQCERLLALPVHGYNLVRTLRAYRLKIGCHILRRRICYLTGENIRLEQIIVVVERLEYDVLARQLASGLYIVVNLVVQTAFQFGAHTGELRRIQ